MTLRVDVLTLFPDAIANYASTSVLGRASERGVWEVHLHDLRDATDDVHRSVDDAPSAGEREWCCAPSRSFARSMNIPRSRGR